MLRFPEEILLLFLDEKSGGLMHVPESQLHFVLGGAALMDLAIEGRLDTDLEKLTLLDDTPLGDTLLDPVLADIAAADDPHNPRSTSFWIERIARRGEEIRSEAVRRLLEAGILESPDDGYLVLANSVMRSRLYVTPDGNKFQEVRLRIMQILFTDEIPTPRDVVIISLLEACGHFERLLSRAELLQVRSRIDLLSRMDLIGQELIRAIRRQPQARREPWPGPGTSRIPVVRGLPVLGSVLDFRRDIIGFLTEVTASTARFSGAGCMNRKFTILVGPEANKFVARKGNLCLSTYWSWRDFVAEQGAKRDIINMDGAEHMRLRRALAWGYSKGLYENSLGTALAITRRVLDDFEPNTPISAHRMLQRMVIEQIGMITTGFDARSYVDTLIEYLNILLATRVARIAPPLLYARRFKKLSARLEELFLKVLRSRPMTPSDGRGDLVDNILDLHRQDPQFLPESDLRTLFLAPFLAGIDTAAGTAVFMLYALLRHPGLLEKMRAEGDPVFEKGVPTVKALRKLDVTRRIAMEALRRYPLAPGMFRTVVNSFDLAGHRIPVGTRVFVGHGVTHFLPEFFPDPYVFDIERYTSKRAEHRQRHMYVPYGLGEHRCLGAGFAKSLLLLTISAIVHYTDPALVDPGYKLKTTTVPTLRPDRRFLVRFPPRRF